MSLVGAETYKNFAEKFARSYSHAILSDVLSPIQDDLNYLNEHLLHFLPVLSQRSKDIAMHVLQSGGKRIRPALFFYACKMFHYRGEHYFPLAAVCEFVHTASLLHDDVIDHSHLRRNKPTANSIWGDESAVLVGDLIYARASELMAETGSLDIVQNFAKSIRLMSEGELLQLEHLFNFSMSEEDYMKIIYCKTAALISATTRSSACLANLNLTQRAAMEDFGFSVGVAFQLIDDALDYTASKINFGKATLADLPQGKVTLPFILLREKTSPQELEWLRTHFQNSQSLLSENMKEVQKLVERYDTANETFNRAKVFTQRAQTALAQFPDSLEKEQLKDLTDKLLKRIS